MSSVIGIGIGRLSPGVGVTGKLGWIVSSGSENERLEPAVVNGAEEVEVGEGDAGLERQIERRGIRSIDKLSPSRWNRRCRMKGHLRSRNGRGHLDSYKRIAPILSVWMPGR